MAYPADIPTFDSTLPGDPTTVPSHSALHNAVSTALSNVMTTLGTAVNGAVATVRQRFEAIEANDWVTNARIAPAAVGVAEIAALAVTQTKLADGAVLEAKIGNAAVVDAKVGAPTTGSLNSGAIRYARMGNIVHVWTTALATGGTLPAGFRPAANMIGTTSTSESGTYKVGSVSVSTLGVIVLNIDAPSSYFSISFSTV